MGATFSAVKVSPNRQHLDIFVSSKRRLANSSCTDPDCPSHHLAPHLSGLDLRPLSPLATLPKPIQPVPPARNNIKPHALSACEDTGRDSPLHGPVGLESESIGTRGGGRPEFVRLGRWGGTWRGGRGHREGGIGPAEGRCRRQHEEAKPRVSLETSTCRKPLANYPAVWRKDSWTTATTKPRDIEADT